MTGRIASPLVVTWPAEGPHGQCPECGESWPLTAEFWDRHHGMRRCRACHRERFRERQRVARLDPERRRADLEASRAMRRAQGIKPRGKRRTPEAQAEYSRRWHQENKERRNAVQRARYAARKADRLADGW